MTSVVLGPQLRRNVLAYVDDIVVICTQRANHIADLDETFANLRTVNLSLKPDKCVFSVHKGKVLGCLVSTKGIEANPDKIKALENMEEPQSIKDAQKLTGRIVALNRFITQSGDRSLLFFKIVRHSAKFDWVEQQREAFNSLNKYLTKMTKMTAPDPKDPLLLYVSAS